MPQPSLPPLALDRRVPADTDVLVVGVTGSEPSLVGLPDDLAAAYTSTLSRSWLYPVVAGEPAYPVVAGETA